MDMYVHACMYARVCTYVYICMRLYVRVCINILVGFVYPCTLSSATNRQQNIHETHRLHKVCVEDPCSQLKRVVWDSYTPQTLPIPSHTMDNSTKNLWHTTFSSRIRRTVLIKCSLFANVLCRRLSWLAVTVTLTLQWPENFPWLFALPQYCLYYLTFTFMFTCTAKMTGPISKAIECWVNW